MALKNAKFEFCQNIALGRFWREPAQLCWIKTRRILNCDWPFMFMCHQNSRCEHLVRDHRRMGKEKEPVPVKDMRMSSMPEENVYCRARE